MAERRAEKEQFVWGLAGCGKDFGIYSEREGKPLEHLSREVVINLFLQGCM